MNAFSVEGPGLLAPDPDFLHAKKSHKKAAQGALAPLDTSLIWPPLGR